jgi:hypothetical protein
MPRILRITPEMAGVPAAAPLARQGDTPSPWPAVAKAATSLASTVETTGNQLIRIQGALQEEDAKLDAQEKFNKLKYDVAKRDVELRANVAMPQAGPVGASDMNGGVGMPSMGGGPEQLAGPPEDQDPSALGPTPAQAPAGPAGLLSSLPALIQAPQAVSRPYQPHEYAEVYSKEFDRMVEESVKGLKYPGTARQYRAMLAPFVGQQKIDALNRGIKLQHEAIMVRDHLDAQTEMRQYVYGTDAEKARAKTARFERLNRQLAGGLRSAESYTREVDAWNAGTQRGEIDRDSYNPVLVDRVMDRLQKREYEHLSADEQERRLNHIITQRDAAARKKKEERQEAVEQVERDTVLLVRDAKTPEDLAVAANTVRDLMSPEKRLLSSEKGEHYLMLIDKKSAPQKLEDDPDTMKLIQPRVMSTAYTSEAQIQQVEGEVDALLQNNRITATTHRVLRNELDQRRIKLKSADNPVEKAIVKSHEQVEASIKRLIKTEGMMSADYKLQTAAVLEDALTELGKESYAAGGKLHPQEWWDRRRPYFMARLADKANEYAEGVATGVPVGYRPNLVGIDKPLEGLREINTAIAKLQTDKPKLPPGVYYQNAEKLMELRILYTERARLEVEQKAAAAEARRLPPPTTQGGAPRPALPAQAGPSTIYGRTR